MCRYQMKREHKEGTDLKNWANATAKTERVVSKDKTVLVIWFGDLPLPPPVVRNSERVLRLTWSRKVHGVWSTLSVAHFIFLYPYIYILLLSQHSCDRSRRTKSPLIRLEVHAAQLSFLSCHLAHPNSGVSTCFNFQHVQYLKIWWAQNEEG